MQNIVETEILLQLSLLSNTRGTEKQILEKVLTAYIKKTGCNSGAVVYKDDDKTEIRRKVPVIEDKHWSENPFFNELIKKDPEKGIHTERKNNTHYYRFLLEEYGYLILIRKKPFSYSFLYELAEVISNLGMALHRKVLIEKYRKSRSKISGYDRLLHGLAKAENKLLETYDYKKAVYESMMTVGKASGADRMYLFTFNEEDEQFKGAISQRFEWNSGTSTPQINNPELQDIPISEVSDTLDVLQKGEVFEAIIEDLPDSRATKPYFEMQNIKSVVLIPVKLYGAFWGFIGFDDCTKNRVWSPAEKSLLKSYSAAFSKAEENRRSRIKLSKSNRLLKTITENAEDLIGLSDLKGNFKYISSSIKNVLGYEPEEVATPEFKNLVTNYFKIPPPEKIEDSIKQIQGRKRTITHKFPKKNGELAWLETSLAVISDPEDPETKGVQLISRDITSRIKLKREQAENDRKEKELINLRKVFVSMASHQFRTPLTVIRSNIELINLSIAELNRNKKQRAQELLDKASGRINKQINLMGDLMNDILLLGKSHEHGLKPKFNNTEINQLIKDCVTDLRVKNKVDVHLPEHSVMLYTDPGLLSHAVKNLIENAVKYTPKNRPSPSVTLIDHSDEILIRVSDAGIGIPEGELDKVSNTFYRASNTEKIAGTGLGLSIVKEFSDALNGRLTIHSKRDKGTRATISFDQSAKPGKSKAAKAT